MQKFRIAIGVRVRIDGVPYRFAGKYQDGWHLAECATNVLHPKTLEEIDRLYLSGTLVLDSDQIDETPQARETRRRREVEAPSDMTGKKRKRFQMRRKVLQEVERRTTPGTRHAKIRVDGRTTTILEHTLAQISRELGCKSPVSRATYYRWLRLFEERGEPRDLVGNFANRGNRFQLDEFVKRTVIDVMNSQLDEAEENQGKVGRRPLVTISGIKKEVEKIIAARNAAELDPSKRLRPPSLATYYNYWNQMPADRRAIAQYGKTRARNMLRGVHGPVHPDACNERAEFDEMFLPFYFFDEDTGVPLGKGYQAWFVDAFSALPTGLCLSFEPLSDATLTSALRQACLPKLWVQDEYPSIQHPWLGWGVPRTIVCDNAMAPHSRTMEDVTGDIGSFYNFAPVRTPWFKPYAEGMIHVLNQTLLREMPGFDLGIDRTDYDPRVNGCIGIRHYLLIFYSWLCDVYAVTRHKKLGSTPNERWQQGTRVVEPERVGRAHDLNLLFGIVRKGRLDHRGVWFEGLQYYGDNADDLRRRRGASISVDLKVHPYDLGSLSVREPRSKSWLPLTAVRYDYANGMTLHRHRLNRKFARNKLDQDDVEGYWLGQQALQALIANALPMALSIRTNMMIARAVGLGTQHVTTNINHDGRLGPLTGPYAGQPLNPFRDARIDGLPAPEPLGLTPPPLASELQPQSTSLAARTEQRPKIPVFESDRSLKKQSAHH